MTKTDLQKTTDWLKKHDIRYEINEDGVHVDERIAIPNGEKVSLPALAKAGSVSVWENATLNADNLAKAGSVSVRENATLNADNLVEVAGSVHVRENATLNADNLAKAGSVSVWENATLNADNLVEVAGSVYVWENATLNAVNLVEVAGSVYVRENATLNAVNLAKVGYVYVREGATLTAPALRTIGHVVFNTTMFGHVIEVYDGIGTVTVSKKERDGITIRSCRKAQFEDGKLVGDKMYVVSSDGHNAHGETLSSALSDLSYKTADRDVSNYQNMPMDTVKPPYEWATIYRVITGACQLGTEDFIKQQGPLKDEYTLAEIIELTRGAYGSERFREVVA